MLAPDSIETGGDVAVPVGACVDVTGGASAFDLVGDKAYVFADVGPSQERARIAIANLRCGDTGNVGDVQGAAVDEPVSAEELLEDEVAGHVESVAGNMSGDAAACGAGVHRLLHATDVVAPTSGPAAMILPKPHTSYTVAMSSPPQSVSVTLA